MDQPPEKTSKLVEIALATGQSADAIVTVFLDNEFDDLEFDHAYEPVLMTPSGESENQRTSCVVRIISTDKALEVLDDYLDVIRVWADTPIAEFEDQNHGF